MGRVVEVPPSRLPPESVADARYVTGSQALALLRSTPSGIAPDEAARRLAAYGPNALELRPPVPAWRVLVSQFRSVVVLLLVVAMAVAGISGDFLEALAIAVVLILNAGIGFVTEIRARRAMEALVQIGRGEATVMRGGEPRRLASEELVPGDVIVLAEGETVPADGRLLEVAELRVNESALTGESVPVSKGVDPLPRHEPPEPLADRANSVFKGTLIATGQGAAVVTATGDDTEIGRISELAQAEEKERTPLEHQLDRLGRRLIWLTLLAAAVVMVLGWLRGNEWVAMLETGIALAIAAVPEGLPAVATITLALGMRRMAARQALVRRLPAVETLGSCTVVCTDKTGTLTEGSMTAVRFALPGRDVEVTGVGLGPDGGFVSGGAELDPIADHGLHLALLTGLMASHGRVVRTDPGEEAGPGEEPDGGGEQRSSEWTVEGDPTEGALVVAARKAGLERAEMASDLPKLDEVPFSSERRFMAVLFGSVDGDRLVFAKGSVDRILDRCDTIVAESPSGGEPDTGGTRSASAVARVFADVSRTPLSSEEKAKWLDRSERLGEEGLRVLALAAGDPGPSAAFTDEGPAGLCFLGLVGLQDPADEAVQPTIQALGAAGIRTVMITGDQHATALSVAQKVGVLEGWEETLSGLELASLSDTELADRSGSVGLYSRVDPGGKLRIVEALRVRGEIVGMLGDGVNDAAALRAADVGVAMGVRGTDVARETADLVLLDDRFETVTAAVEEGRVIFDNIRKFIYYLFSCNLSEVLVLLVAGAAGWPLPLLPLQILWLNLLTDVLPALTLAAEPGEAGVMTRPPRDPAEAMMSSRFLGSVSAGAALLTLSTLGVFAVGLRLEEGEVGVAMTMAFSTLALTQLAHAFNARSRRPVLFTGRFLANPWVLGAVVLAALLQVAAVHLPSAQAVLHTAPLGPREWAWVLVGSLVPLVVGQAARALAPSRLPA